MSQAIRSRYIRRSAPYSSHYSSRNRAPGSVRNNNGKPVLAKRIILQSTVCIIIVCLCILCQNSTEELPQSIIAEIRTRVVEQNITAEGIFQSFTDTYEECVQYIQGND
ncbi:MAG: hypothetical protein KBA53_06840 [Thermoclostridium sp.]|nr:hypothetical protein [Thermoclostridium sp.]